MQLRNWAGNITFTSGRLHTPRTLDEVQQVVAEGTRVRALGTGHSFNRIADTAGDLISLRELGATVEVDAEAGTVVVPGGARYGEVSSALQNAGLALHNLGSLPHISVAGACATGTHGSGVGNRCLATAVVAVEYVRADGELVQAAVGEPDFPGSVLALGALGIVTRLTLAVEASYEVRQDVWLGAPVDTVLDDLEAVLSAGYSVSLFTDWARPEVFDKIWVKSRTGEPVVDGRRWGAGPAEIAQHPIEGQDPVAATEQLGRPGPWNARLPHFRLEFTPSNGDEQQSEYLVASEHGAEAIRAVLGLGLRGVAQVAEFRTIAADELWLSPFHQRASVGLHFTWVDDDEAVARAVTAVERALDPFDARPHWGKVFLAEPAAVRAHYPGLPDFQALAARHDPGRKFGNEFLERFVY